MLLLNGHTAPIRSLAYAPDGARLASASEDGTVRIWDLRTRRALRVLKPDDHVSVEAVAWSPDGNRLACGCSRGLVSTWWTSPWERTLGSRVNDRQGPRSLVFLPNSETVLIAYWAGQVAFFHLGARPGPDWIVQPTNGPARAVACPPQGSLCAVGTQAGTVYLLETAELRRPQPEQRIIGPKMSGGVFALAFAPDGTRVAAGDSRGELALLDVAGQHAPVRRRGHDKVVYGLAFTPDGSLLASGGADGTVRVWDAATLTERATFRWEQSWITSLAFAPDGMTAAAGCAGHTIVVWDVDAMGA